VGSEILSKAIRVVAGLAAIAGAVVVFTTGGQQPVEGRDGVTIATQRQTPAVEGYFRRESYRPGSTATLVVTTHLRAVTIQVFRTGETPIAGRQRDELRGVAVTSPRRVRLPSGSGEQRVTVRIGDWPSGVYYAQLKADDGRIGYAVFVLAPSRLGTNRVAVVMPTNTWFAYNRRDADGSGKGDTWYEDPAVRTIDITRPSLDRGVPPHFGHYDLPFIRWLAMKGKEVDFLAQADLERAASGDALFRAYDLIVFPGHHEYVTTHEYDVIERYRNLGGNLMFLSANNFFWRVTKTADSMTRTAQWRDLGRPEASLIGVQYIGNDRGEHRGAYRVRRAPAGQWIFAETGHTPGTAFGNFGIEIDHTAAASPDGVQVLAEIPDLLAPGKTAQMSYYETKRGAKVFAAGAFTLGGAALWPDVSRLLENLWERLADDRKPATADLVSTLRALFPAQNDRAPAAHLAASFGSLSPACEAGNAGGTQAAYGWPVKPFHRQHPVRGYFGDPRIGKGSGGERTHTLHFGVDVSAPNGTAVYATADGIVSRHPLHDDVVVLRAADGAELEYWHVEPVVASGESVQAYRTVIGHILRPWAHVHVAERRAGRYVNPLRPGGMGPYADHTCPAAARVSFERAGHLLDPARLHGSFDLVVAASDSPAMSVPPPWAGLPVAPALVRWRVVDSRGEGVTPWRTAFDAREILPGADFFAIYAEGTTQNHVRQPGSYRFRLARAFAGGSLQPGTYAVQVGVTDSAGNRSSSESPFTVSA
jgi:murein DD-endopeptidase MepM/ murein hydrolase activator NlpD